MLNVLLKNSSWTFHTLKMLLNAKSQLNLVMEIRADLICLPNCRSSRTQTFRQITKDKLVWVFHVQIILTCHRLQVHLINISNSPHGKFYQNKQRTIQIATFTPKLSALTTSKSLDTSRHLILAESRILVRCQTVRLSMTLIRVWQTLTT